MFQRKVPFIQQLSEMDCGAACITMILHYYGNKIPLFEVSKNCSFSRNGITLRGIVEISEKYGLVGKIFKCQSVEELKNERIIMPAILLSNKGHYVVLESITNNSIMIVDPGIGHKKVLLNNLDDFPYEVIIILSKNAHFKGQKHYPNNVFSAVKDQMKTSKKALGASIFFSFVIEFCSLILPLCTSFMIDQIIGKDQYDMMPVILIIGIIAALLYGIANYIKGAFMLNISYKFWRDFSKTIVKKIFNLQLRYFDVRASGDISNRINNINIIKDIMARIFSSLVVNVVSVIVFGIAMLLVSFQLSIIVLFIAFLQALIFSVFIRKMRVLMQENLDNQEITYTYLLEILKNIILVKCSDWYSNIVLQWQEHFQAQWETSLKKDRFSNIFQSVLLFLKVVPSIVLLVAGSYHVQAGKLTLGSLMAFISISSLFITPISTIANDLQDLTYLRTIMERLMEIYYAEECNYDKKKIIKGPINIVKMENVSFGYSHSENLILKNINVSITKGEKIAFVGRTGSGKSTLIKLVLGLYPVDDGTVNVNNICMGNLNLDDFRKHIGIAMQDAYFFNDTIEKNIDITGNYTDQDIEDAAKIAQLDCDIKLMPLGYKTKIGENGKSLSGGQKQRLAIARALVKKPDIIIFDEGTNQLDAITEREIYEALKKNNITQIVITHRLSAVIDADKIFVIDEGIIREQGTHEELLTMNGLYSHMWSKQN